ncbi:catalase [Toxoplasma gondii TgCatPRC2]|uniref:Catalase n=7 Tax=Toxoplasma gondii TaxID=5811 RepID=B6KJS2_TOXGV|nr:catalase [Toxoplasma gondii ME49]ESS35750.1 catalase [Toxoplasma gondii VEG]KFG63769.1 catalase [Toxoplasma gondii RUB]KFH17342.1 catalase [Toxoplasma gondii MAS]KYF46205.1 catalase [Toxoplasma gondii ARI]KYK63613.1 catalase [Toxoplasma gondii TgCatPRC2]PIM03172.1 catalase [Toxoplasma gondii COUG]|eukprot:XP_002368095.1 catalase [Toxoplasma gondii ME49]
MTQVPPVTFQQYGPVITTSAGNPVDDNQNSVTAGPYGPAILSNFHLIDKLAHFDRERIPERVVHAKGGGAFGYFEVTHDITRFCKAKLFEKIGKRTPVFARFSTVAGESGSADTRRDPRGFALKFYTEEGNWDMVGNNTPIFFVRDAIKFPDFIHTQKRHPQTHLHDPNMVWDFFSLVPESVHQVTFLYTDRGTPDGFRHMNGYGSHTFKFINKDNEAFYVKWHFKTNQGIKNLNRQRAKELESEDPDYAVRDLFNAIAKREFPSWTFCIQVMPLKDAETYKWNVFDVTKVWPHGDYPLIPVGRLVLDRNPENYFQDVEQAAFAPAHMVPGIEPSEDRMLQGRMFSYIDTHRHRLGANYHQIPVNRPWNARGGDYSVRDGPMCVDGNKGSQLNYEPNSVDGFPKEDRNAAVSGTTTVSGTVACHPQEHPNSDFEQPGNFYRTVLSEPEREALIGNIAEHLRQARRDIQERQVKIFYKCDPEYGERVARAIGLPTAACYPAKM